MHIAIVLEDEKNEGDKEPWENSHNESYQCWHHIVLSYTQVIPYHLFAAFTKEHNVAIFHGLFYDELWLGGAASNYMTLL